VIIGGINSDILSIEYLPSVHSVTDGHRLREEERIVGTLEGHLKTIVTRLTIFSSPVDLLGTADVGLHFELVALLELVQKVEVVVSELAGRVSVNPAYYLSVYSSVQSVNTVIGAVLRDGEVDTVKSVLLNFDLVLIGGDLEVVLGGIEVLVVQAEVLNLAGASLSLSTPGRENGDASGPLAVGELRRTVYYDPVFAVSFLLVEEDLLAVKRRVRTVRARVVN